MAEVIDGDTLKAAIDLGLGVWTVQKLRLRGLDAPEIESAEGREAKAFLEKQVTRGCKKLQDVAKGSEKSKTTQPLETSGNLLQPLEISCPVLIRTSKSDKYDRYLADLFVNGEYINQTLIDEGLAARVSE